MNALIVHAHPEPRSFNAALRDAACETLAAQGYTVEVSDLYAQAFDPVAGRGDFTTCLDADRFNLSLEQRHAVVHGGLAPDVARELDRLLRADLLVLQFPLWWFGMPAILKGWIDRVFLSGTVYGRSAVFERGRLRGKRAVACVTTGAPESAFGPDSLNGELLSLLAPLHRGVLGFTGMTVLPPFVAWGVPYAGDAARAGMILGWRAHLAGLDALAPLPMPRVADHPEAGMGPGAPKAR
jgi:NAD(P)H dehydrogenase (quinone)